MLRSKKYVLEFSVDMIIEKDGDGYHVYSPVLKGLHIDGKTKKRAIEIAKRAVKQHLETLVENRLPIPVGYTIHKIPSTPHPMHHRINTRLTLTQCRV